MRLNTKDMVGVLVETTQGTPLGRVASFDVDSETGRLLALRVRASGLVARFAEGELVVAWTAIRELASDRVVVDEAVVKTSEQMNLSSSRSLPVTAALMTGVETRQDI